MRFPAKSLVIGLGLLAASLAQGAGKYAALEKCYKTDGQLEETTSGNKKTTTYKSEAEVAEDCNEKVIAKAKGEKDVKNLNELASIIGRNSNWQSALPVYTAGAKAKAKVCKEKSALDAADLALSSPKDDAHSKGALDFYGACWPESKDVVLGLLKDDADSYHKEHLCGFLKAKKALPKDKDALCKAAG